MPAEAFDRSQSTKLAEGKFLTLDNQVDTTTGTVKVKARFTNADGALFPNQFVNIKLVVDTLRGAAIVPSAAIQIGAPGSYVYVANPDSTVSVRPIKVGPSNGERVAVLDGLAPGDNVVVDGVDRLRDGAKIRVPEAASSNPNPAGTSGKDGEPRNRKREQK